MYTLWISRYSVNSVSLHFRTSLWKYQSEVTGSIQLLRTNRPLDDITYIDISNLADSYAEWSSVKCIIHYCHYLYNVWVQSLLDSDSLVIVIINTLQYAIFIKLCNIKKSFVDLAYLLSHQFVLITVEIDLFCPIVWW